MWFVVQVMITFMWFVENVEKIRIIFMFDTGQPEKAESFFLTKVGTEWI